MSLDKIPYIPSEIKRFDISEDEFSRERLRAVLEVYRELKKVFPSIGFSLYGSLTKGKVLDEMSKTRSDIDLAVYVDANELLANAQELSLPTFAHHLSPAVIDKRSILDMSELLKLTIAEFLSKKLHSEPSWRSIGNVFDLHIYPLAREENGFEELYKKHQLAESGKPGGSRALSKIFRLDVGGGMKAWRQFVFDQLSAYTASDRERIWKEIDTSIREHERKGNIPQKIEKQFPKTFAEAKRYYTHEV